MCLGDHGCPFLFFLLLILGPTLPSHIFSFSNTPEFLWLVTKKAGIHTQVYGLQSPSSWSPDVGTDSQVFEPWTKPRLNKTFFSILREG